MKSIRLFMLSNLEVRAHRDGHLELFGRDDETPTISESEVGSMSRLLARWADMYGDGRDFYFDRQLEREERQAAQEAAARQAEWEAHRAKRGPLEPDKTENIETFKPSSPR